MSEMNQTPETGTVEVKLRVPADIMAEIDRRREIVQAATGKPCPRNLWFANVAKWVVYRLPHEAVRADLIAAWDDMPPETLGIDR